MDARPTNRRASTISVFMTDEVSDRLIPVSFIALTSASDALLDDPEEIADVLNVPVGEITTTRCYDLRDLSRLEGREICVSGQIRKSAAPRRIFRPS